MKKIIIFILLLLFSIVGYSQSTLISAPVESQSQDSILNVDANGVARHTPYSTFQARLKLYFDTLYAGTSADLGDLGDVTITSPISQEVLTWNGSAWVNQVFGAGSETDPIYIADPAFSITVQHLTDLSNLSGVNTGDQILVNYVTLDGTQIIIGVKTFENGTLLLRNVADTFNGQFLNINTADRTYTLQDADGTIAFTSDITGTNTGTNTGDQDLSGYAELANPNTFLSTANIFAELLTVKDIGNIDRAEYIITNTSDIEKLSLWWDSSLSGISLESGLTRFTIDGATEYRWVDNAVGTMGTLDSNGLFLTQGLFVDGQYRESQGNFEFRNLATEPVTFKFYRDGTNDLNNSIVSEINKFTFKDEFGIDMLSIQNNLGIFGFTNTLALQQGASLTSKLLTTVEYVRDAISGSSLTTNLSYISSPTNGIITSDTGTNATIPLTDGTNAGLMTSAEQVEIAVNTFKISADALTYTLPLSTSTNIVSMTQVGLAQNGWLSSVDFTTFNNKLSIETDPIWLAEESNVPRLDGINNFIGLSNIFREDLTIGDASIYDSRLVFKFNGSILGPWDNSIWYSSTNVNFKYQGEAYLGFHDTYGTYSIKNTIEVINSSPTGNILTTRDYTLAKFEPKLSNPIADGYILSSTLAGVRSWIPNSGGGGIPEPTLDGSFVRKKDGTNYTWEVEIENANLVSGTNISIDNSDPLNPIISSVTSTTAGIIDRVYFTGDIVTLNSIPFYSTKREDRGIVSAGVQTVNVDDNTKAYFSQDFISVPFLSDGVIDNGSYTSYFTVHTDGDHAQERYTIEIYLADTDGNVLSSGIVGAIIGDLGVAVIAIADSGIVDLKKNNDTQLGLSSYVSENVSVLTGQRVRYHVSAEKVGTDGGVVNLDLHFGTSYNSYIEMPTPLSSDNVRNVSTVSGATVTDALEALANISGGWQTSGTTVVNNPEIQGNVEFNGSVGIGRSPSIGIPLHIFKGTSSGAAYHAASSLVVESDGALNAISFIGGANTRNFLMFGRLGANYVAGYEYNNATSKSYFRSNGTTFLEIEANHNAIFDGTVEVSTTPIIDTHVGNRGYNDARYLQNVIVAGFNNPISTSSQGSETTSLYFNRDVPVIIGDTNRVIGENFTGVMFINNDNVSTLTITIPDNLSLAGGFQFSAAKFGIADVIINPTGFTTVNGSTNPITITTQYTGAVQLIHIVGSSWLLIGNL